MRILYEYSASNTLENGILDKQEAPRAVYQYNASDENIAQCRECTEDYPHVIQLVRAWGPCRTMASDKIS